MSNKIRLLFALAGTLVALGSTGCGGGSTPATTPPPPTPSSVGNWTWEGGANVVNQPGVYGTLGTAAPGNVPGSRFGAATWTDLAANFWLFGGYGVDSTGTQGALDDLWEYSGGQWKWVGGSNLANQSGTYGTQGTAATGNVPGARSGASSWIDASGNLWLFGGGQAGCLGATCFNDLWEYSEGQWTWISGSNLPGQQGTYGTLGVPAPGNVPGARWGAASWIDSSGDLWLFGGDYDNPAVQGGLQINDLWKYSGGEWTWVGGSNLPGDSNSNGVYGTLGTPAPGNIPGNRSSESFWVDSFGNFWLFGGESEITLGFFQQNDLWKYSSGEWTWISGSDTVGHAGMYGTVGTAAPGNVPGARYGAASWIDSSGDLLLFGGETSDLTTGVRADLNDLWKYSTGQWTWVSGTNQGNQPGIYGTLGTAGSTNLPGARLGASAWTDKSGNFWLFGGETLDTTTGVYQLNNDLWKYQP